MKKLELVTPRDKINPNPSKVGQAVVDILSKDQKEQTVEETLQASSESFLEHFRQAVDRGMKKFSHDFYILVLGKKEPWAINVERQWFIDRNTYPILSLLIQDYPNHNKTLYKIDRGGNLDPKVIWSLPGHQDCISIARNPHPYHPDLVKWVLNGYEGLLDREPEISFSRID